MFDARQLKHFSFTKSRSSSSWFAENLAQFMIPREAHILILFFLPPISQITASCYHHHRQQETAFWDK
jgi:hypothetical protein